MERSRNQNLLPMKGTIERETRRKAMEARATRLIIQSLQEQQPPISPPEDDVVE